MGSAERKVKMKWCRKGVGEQYAGTRYIRNTLSTSPTGLAASRHDFKTTTAPSLSPH